MRGIFSSPVTKFAVVLAVATMVSTLGTSVALATSDTGTQNPDVTVSISLSPDVVTAGDTLTASGSATNNTTKKRRFKVVLTLTVPGGASFSVKKSVRLGPGKTVSVSESFTIPAGLPLGQYSLTLSATNKNGTSSATATTTLQ